MSTVRRTAGVAGSFPVTFGQPPVGTPTRTIYRDAARTEVADAAAPLVSTSNDRVWIASYPATLAAGDYPLSVSAVYTAGQPAKVDQAQTLELVPSSVSVGSQAFATVADLSARTGVAYEGGEALRVQALLEDASAHLRDIIGAQVYPQADVDVRAVAFGPRLPLPTGPVQVLQVTAGGRTVTAEEMWDVGGAVALVNGGGWCGNVTMRLRLGYAAPPPELVRWTCVLAAQALAMPAGQLGMTSGGSVAVDDFRQSWDGAVGDVPERAAQRLRESYGSAVTVTGTDL